MGHLGRRYLKTREYNWVRLLAKKVSKLNITPNQISLMSVFFALFASFSFLTVNNPIKWLLVILFIQFRLFCNMLDGLVAIEGGKQSKLGDLYNDLPDRFADILIIISYGYAISGNYLVELAWLAAMLSIFTAYIRTLFTSIGARAHYIGPMAKQHRMFTLCLSCLLYYFYPEYNIILITLIILNIGMLITIYRRIQLGVKDLLC